MVQRKDGSPPTADEIRRYADFLEQQLFQFRKEAVATAPDTEYDHSIKLLNLQQDRIVEDLRAINTKLTDIATAISGINTSVNVLEQKYEESSSAIRRAHTRIDRMGDDFTRHRDKFDDKLQKLEVTQARNAWVGSAAAVVIGAILAAWAKGLI